MTPSTPRPDAEVQRYHLLRAAVELFQRPPAALEQEELAKARAQASRTGVLESLVLAAPEAQDVVIDRTQVEQAVADVAKRYPDRVAFLADLASNGLDEEGLAHALYRELCFDAVLRRVGSARRPVTDEDIELYYELHRDKFDLPERRAARHILVTINPDYPDNSPEAALRRIQAVARELGRHPEQFAALAQRHSECPTALEEGRLGTLVPGQLYPELDRLLFQLEAGAFGGPVQTQVGYHLILCESIEPSRHIPFAEARERIAQSLDDHRRNKLQKEWVRGLANRAKEA